MTGNLRNDASGSGLLVEAICPVFNKPEVLLSRCLSQVLSSCNFLSIRQSAWKNHILYMARYHLQYIFVSFHMDHQAMDIIFYIENTAPLEQIIIFSVGWNLSSYRALAETSSRFSCFTRHTQKWSASALGGHNRSSQTFSDSI